MGVEAVNLATEFTQAGEIFLQTSIQITPTLIPPLLFFVTARLFISFTEDAKHTAPFEILFFSILGAGAAYINAISTSTFSKEIFPHVIAGFVLVSQVVGLMSGKLAAPFSTRRVLLGATGGVVSFMIAARYLELAIATDSSS